ncbi:Uncharacterised protein [Mycobacteroides abscessus subsp. abscessus]|nr:Uncharacterised protein [Mycobacteroides abscessus subsp. abscessus]
MGLGIVSTQGMSESGAARGLTTGWPARRRSPSASR